MAFGFGDIRRFLSAPYSAAASALLSYPRTHERVSVFLRAAFIPLSFGKVALGRLKRTYSLSEISSAFASAVAFSDAGTSSATSSTGSASAFASVFTSSFVSDSVFAGAFA